MSYLIRNSKHVIPGEYVEVEYIENTSTSYINTSILPKNTIGIEIKASICPNNDTDNIIIGSRQNSLDTRFWIDIDWGVTDTLGWGFNTYTAKEKRFSIVGKQGQIIVVSMNYFNDRLGKVNGITYDNFNGRTISNSVYPITIFAGNKYGEISLNALSKIYYVNISDGQNIIMSLIPVKKKSNNEYGMYDLVSKQFFGNQGTGAFAGGEEVINTKTYNIQNNNILVPSEYEEVEYLQSDGISNAYINLDIHFNPLDTIETKFANEETNGVDKYMVIASPWNSPSNTRFAMGHHNSRFTCGWGSISTGGSSLIPNTTFNKLPHTWTYKNRKFTITDLNISYTGSWSAWAGGEAKPSSTSGFVRLMWGYNAKTKGKMYYYHHITKDGTERYLIPVKKKATNEYGMYDIVSKKFFGNNGTGSFTGGQVVNKNFTYAIQNNSYTKSHLLNNFYISALDRKVPSEYDEVEYIRSASSATSSNYQKIETGILSHNGISVKAKLNGAGWSFGGRNNTNNSIGLLLNPTATYYQYGQSKNDNVNRQNVDLIVELDGNKCILNNTIVMTFTEKTFDSTQQIWLFAMNDNGSPNTSVFKNGKIYYFKIYDNGELIRDYIPVKNKTTNEYGLYDLVSKQFFGNKGTGAFAGGNVIQPKLKSFLIKGGN